MIKNKTTPATYILLDEYGGEIDRTEDKERAEEGQRLNPGSKIVTRQEGIEINEK